MSDALAEARKLEDRRLKVKWLWSAFSVCLTVAILTAAKEYACARSDWIYQPSWRPLRPMASVLPPIGLFLLWARSLGSRYRDQSPQMISSCLNGAWLGALAVTILFSFTYLIEPCREQFFYGGPEGLIYYVGASTLLAALLIPIGSIIGRRGYPDYFNNQLTTKRREKNALRGKVRRQLLIYSLVFFLVFGLLISAPALLCGDVAIAKIVSEAPYTAVTILTPSYLVLLFWSFVIVEVRELDIASFKWVMFGGWAALSWYWLLFTSWEWLADCQSGPLERPTALSIFLAFSWAVLSPILVLFGSLVGSLGLRWCPSSEITRAVFVGTATLVLAFLIQIIV